jgi:hypothetical protein
LLNGNNQDEIGWNLGNKLERNNNQDQVKDESYKISKQIKQASSEDPNLELRIRDLNNLFQEL